MAIWQKAIVALFHFSFHFLSQWWHMAFHVVLGRDTVAWCKREGAVLPLNMILKKTPVSQFGIHPNFSPWNTFLLVLVKEATNFPTCHSHHLRERLKTHLWKVQMVTDDNRSVVLRWNRCWKVTAGQLLPGVWLWSRCRQVHGHCPGLLQLAAIYKSALFSLRYCCPIQIVNSIYKKIPWGGLFFFSRNQVSSILKLDQVHLACRIVGPWKDHFPGRARKMCQYD